MSSTGFIYSSRAQRAAQFIFPRDTRVELATRALETLVPRWVENLRTRENLNLETDIDIRGPMTCPWLEEGKFGEDMYVVSGLFTCTRPREVDEDFLWNSRELASDLKVTERKRHRVLPRDFNQQMHWVSTHEDKVYDDLRQGAKALTEARNAKEI